MIPGKKKIEINSLLDVDETKKSEEFRSNFRSQSSNLKEENPKKNKVPLLPTCKNQQMYTGKVIHNIMKAYGLSRNCNDDNYSTSYSGRTPNNDCSDSMNPNNHSNKASMDNLSVQLNRK
ncbi:hypothetical protein [Methanospirillum sp.]